MRAWTSRAGSPPLAKRHVEQRLRLPDDSRSSGHSSAHFGRVAANHGPQNVVDGTVASGVSLPTRRTCNGSRASIVRAASAVSIAVLTILSDSDSLIVAAAIELQQRVAAGGRRRECASAPTAASSVHSSPLIVRRPASSHWRASSADQRRARPRRPRPAPRSSTTTATVRSNASRSLTRRASCSSSKSVAGSAAGFEHVGIDAVAGAVDVDHVVIGGAVQVFGSSSRRRHRRSSLGIVVALCDRPASHLSAAAKCRPEQVQAQAPARSPRRWLPTARRNGAPAPGVALRVRRLIGSPSSRHTSASQRWARA